MYQVRRFTALATVVMLVLAACSHPSDKQYTADDVGRIVDTSQAKVISSRTVSIRGGENSGIGAVAGGAAAGSVANAAVSGGEKEFAATIIAGLIGAGLGFLVEEEARSRSGIEYVLQTQDGRTITLLQNRGANEQPIEAGQSVLIQYGAEYTRVVPLPSGVAPAAIPGDDTRDYNGLDTGRGVAPATTNKNSDVRWSDPGDDS